MKKAIQATMFLLLVGGMISELGAEGHSPPRLALVVGNADYDGDAALKNPVNDAQDVAQALKEIGWSVQLVQNADRRTFSRAVTSFRDSLAAVPDAIALFFYAGHAMQAEGQNFLIPVKTTFETLDDVRLDAINVSLVTDSIQQAGAQISLMILDSCRDNPFAKKMTRSLGGTRGLTVVQGAGGTKGSAILFSTGPGDVARDGDGRNGVFTAALLKQIKTDAKLEDVFKAVSSEVRSATGNAQKPWINASLSSDFYLISDQIRATHTAQLAELARAEEAKRAAATSGKVRFESFAKGQVFLGDQLLGDIDVGAPLTADSLKTGSLVFRFVAVGRTDESKTATITDKAYTTIVFAKTAAGAPAVVAATPSIPAPSIELVDTRAVSRAVLVDFKPMGISTLRQVDPYARHIDVLDTDDKTRLYGALRKEGALVDCLLNTLTLVGVGSYVQGDLGWGLYQSTSLVALVSSATLANMVPGDKTVARLAFVASAGNFAIAYLGGLFVPLLFEADYNKALKSSLLFDQ